MESSPNVPTNKKAQKKAPTKATQKVEPKSAPKGVKRPADNYLVVKLSEEALAVKCLTQEEMRALEKGAKVDAQDNWGNWAKAKIVEVKETGVMITYVGFKKSWDRIYLWEEHFKLCPPESRVLPTKAEVNKRKKIEEKAKIVPKWPRIDSEWSELDLEVKRLADVVGFRSSYKQEKDMPGEDEKCECDVGHAQGRLGTKTVIDSIQDDPEQEEIDKPEVKMFEMSECSARTWGRQACANWWWIQDVLEPAKERAAKLQLKKHLEATNTVVSAFQMDFL